jgi:tetratricopeptide (TPR) repeat protein
LILLLAVLVGYANALQGVFQFDDFNVIVNFPRVHNWSAWWSDLGPGLRPLLKLSYTLNWTSGWGVSGFLAFNLALHWACCLLVHALALAMLRWRATASAPEPKAAALLAALLFAMHPMNTEAVSYVSGRSVTLMTLFYLASLLAYERAQQPASARWRWLSPLLFGLAVAAKETAITLPLALLLWDCAARPAAWRSLWRRQAAHWAVFLLLCLALLLHPRYGRLLSFSAGLHSVPENLLTQVHAMTYLLGQWVVPWHNNIDPDLPIIATWSDATVDLAWWCALALLAAWRWRRGPVIGFALGWFALQLLPIYVLFPRVDVANERQLYLAAWPSLVPLAGWLLTGLPGVRLRAGISTLLLLGLAALTVQRNLDYRSEVALWESTVRRSPLKARPYNNLGYALSLQGEFERAQSAYLQALQLDPDYWLAQQNLERLHAAQ